MKLLRIPPVYKEKQINLIVFYFYKKILIEKKKCFLYSRLNMTFYMSVHMLVMYFIRIDGKRGSKGCSVYKFMRDMNCSRKKRRKRGKDKNQSSTCNYSWKKTLYGLVVFFLSFHSEMMILIRSCRESVPNDKIANRQTCMHMRIRIINMFLLFDAYGIALRSQQNDERMLFFH